MCLLDIFFPSLYFVFYFLHCFPFKTWLLDDLWLHYDLCSVLWTVLLWSHPLAVWYELNKGALSAFSILATHLSSQATESFSIYEIRGQQSWNPALWAGVYAAGALNLIVHWHFLCACCHLQMGRSKTTTIYNEEFNYRARTLGKSQSFSMRVCGRICLGVNQVSRLGKDRRHTMSNVGAGGHPEGMALVPSGMWRWLRVRPDRHMRCGAEILPSQVKQFDSAI